MTMRVPEPRRRRPRPRRRGRRHERSDGTTRRAVVSGGETPTVTERMPDAETADATAGDMAVYSTGAGNVEGYHWHREAGYAQQIADQSPDTYQATERSPLP